MKDNKYIKLFLRVLLIVIIFESITQFFISFLAKGAWLTLLYGKYNRYLIAEFIVLIIAVIALFIKKKTYIFKEHNFSFIDTLKIGGPILIIALISFGLNTASLIFNGNFNWPNLSSLILFAACVGLFEEFLFRGLIQNELTEGFGNNKKQVIISIIIASLIFGIGHISNVLYGQALFETIIQVLQTCAIGLTLGLIYYRGKNIWAVAFLHGFYDFSLMLNEVNLYKDCAYMDNVPFNLALATSVTSIFLIIIYLIYAYKLASGIDIPKDISVESSTKKDNIISVVIFVAVLMLVGSFFIPRDNIDDYYICYNYEAININNYETHYYNYDAYNLKNIMITLNESKVTLRNNLTGEEKTLDTDPAVKLVASVDNDRLNIFFLTVDYKDYKLYHTSYDLTENVSFEGLVNSFNYYVVPDSKNIGYLIDSEKNKYPLIVGNTEDLFILKDNKINVIK